MSEFDLFYIYRTAIFLVLTIYYVLYTTTFYVRLWRFLQGDDPRLRMVRMYLSYHVVTVRLAPLRSELLQITLWTMVLLLIVQMHGWVA